MSQKKIGREAILAEIGRLEGMLSLRGAERKSSEDLVEEVDLNTDMGEGAKEAASRCGDFDDIVPLDVDSDEGLLEDVLDDVDFEGGADVLDACGTVASEMEPGIEDEITQDSFDEVEEELGADDIATEDTTKDVVASEYVGRLSEASSRLDRVASYLEKNGQVKLAFRIDRLADALDAERSRLSK